MPGYPAIDPPDEYSDKTLAVAKLMYNKFMRGVTTWDDIQLDWIVQQWLAFAEEVIDLVNSESELGPCPVCNWFACSCGEAEVDLPPLDSGDSRG